MFLEISLVFMVLLFVTSSYIIWNLNKKLELLENWVEQFVQVIDRVNRDLKQVDYRGSFESDDEVGFIFKEIKNTIKQLDRFRGEEQ
jgi:hypothetical protein